MDIDTLLSKLELDVSSNKEALFDQIDTQYNTDISTVYPSLDQSNTFAAKLSRKGEFDVYHSENRAENDR